MDLKPLAVLLNNNFAIDGSLDRIEFNSASCGNTLTEHKNSVQTNVDLSGATITYENLDIPIKLDTLKINVGWARPSRAVFKGQLHNEEVSVDVQGGTLEMLAAGSPWPITAEMVGASARITLDGNAAFGGDSDIINVHFEVDAPRIGALHQWVAVDPASEVPLLVNGSLQWSNENFQIDEFDTALGHSEIKGRLKSFEKDGESVLVTDLQSARFDVTELKSVLLPSENANQSSSQPDRESNHSENPNILLGFDFPSIGRKSDGSLYG